MSALMCCVATDLIDTRFGSGVSGVESVSVEHIRSCVCIAFIASARSARIDYI